jgi:transposase
MLADGRRLGRLRAAAFGNRREVAAYAGLVPTPWRSGNGFVTLATQGRTAVQFATSG